LFFRSGTTCSVPGAPIRSRAISLTACTAENFFGFFFFATVESVSANRACDIIGLSGPIRLGQSLTTSHCPMDEREFFEERPEKKPATLNCPHCHQSADYEVTWLVRTKKRQLSGRADERDRARFAKAKSYMLRKDDVMGCKNVRCRKRFDISGLQSVVFTE